MSRVRHGVIVSGDDDPWTADLRYLERIALARSILGHTDQTTAVRRALAALDGNSIDEIVRLIP
jgi:hypothetical protein